MPGSSALPARLRIFLPDPTEVPSEVVAYVAAQLGITDTSLFACYRGGQIHYDHAAEIRYRYGYHEFTDRAEGFALVRWLYAKLLYAKDNEQPSSTSSILLWISLVLLPYLTKIKPAVILPEKLSALEAGDGP